MRKFIVSDLHGNGNVYDSIMGYLENVNKDEDIILYINGDLIDRGPDSARMLMDVYKKTKKGPFKIVYLGGNHELLMYQEHIKRLNGVKNYYNDWYLNGGWITDFGLEDEIGSKNKKNAIINFISNLKIYQKFDEKINDKNIILIHAACLDTIKSRCDLKIKNNDSLIESCVWTRKNDFFGSYRSKIGNDKYFSIVGHTPNDNKYGFEYDEKENYLNIDGGSSFYVCGDFEVNHVPLVEVKDGLLKILTFNNNNEIIYGNYFDGEKIISYNDDELNKEREKLDKSLIVKKLIRNKDGVVLYSD